MLTAESAFMVRTMPWMSSVVSMREARLSSVSIALPLVVRSLARPFGLAEAGLRQRLADGRKHGLAVLLGERLARRRPLGHLGQPIARRLADGRLGFGHAVRLHAVDGAGGRRQQHRDLFDHGEMVA